MGMLHGNKNNFHPGKKMQDGPLFTAEQIIESAFQYYRSTGFPYPDIPLHVSMQQLNKLAKKKNFEQITNTNLCYRTPDSYHRHRLAVPIQRGRGEQPTPVTIYNDDKLLRRAIFKQLKLGGKVTTGYFSMLAFINGSQGASNFRPGYSMSLYRRFCKRDAVILDPCFGFGGRVIGALASGVAKRYIGFDPSKASYQGNRRMMKDLGYPKFATFWNIPYEDATEEHCIPGSVDFAMTSPPYWSKEHYSKDKGQSWIRYPKLHQWESGFLLPFFQYTLQCLKPGKFFAVCIANVLILGKNRPLVQMAVDCACEAGFIHYDTEHYEIPTNKSGFTGSKARVTEKPEKLLIFRKPLPGESKEQAIAVRARFDKCRHGTKSQPLMEGFFH